MSPTDNRLRSARRRTQSVLVAVLVAVGGHLTPARGEGDDHCLFTLKGHTGIVLGVTYFPRGDRLASAGRDNQVLIWDAATGKRFSTLTLVGEGEAHGYSVACGLEHKVLAHALKGAAARSSSDYTFVFEKAILACGKSDYGRQKGEIVLWDPETKKQLRVLRGHTHAVSAVACSPDGRLVASGSYDSTARIWDARSGKELFTLKGHSMTVYAVAFDPAGKLLASGSADQKIILWDTDSGQKVRTLVGHTSTVYGASFSHDGKRLATGGDDQTVRVWDVATGKQLLTLNGHKGWICGVVFSGDDRLIASGGGDGVVRLWDAASGKELADLKGHSGSIGWVAFNPVRPQLASASHDQTVKVWDVSWVKPESEKK